MKYSVNDEQVIHCQLVYSNTLILFLASESVQEEAMTTLREGLSDQDKKDIAFCKKFFGILDACVKQDPQHESMAETEQELQDLMTSGSVPQCGRFNGLGLISSSLA